MKRLLLTFLVFTAFQPLLAQEPATTQVAQEKELSPGDGVAIDDPKLENVLSILRTYRALREKQLALSEEITELNATSPEGDQGASLEKATKESELLFEKIEGVKTRLEDVALGYRRGGVGSEEEVDLSLSQEFQSLMSPLMEEIRNATKPTRELARLSSEVSALNERSASLKLSIEKLENASRITRSNDWKDDDEIVGLFAEIEESIQSELSLNELDITAATYRLDELRENRRPVSQQLSEGVSSFFAGRGRSLFVAALAAIFVFYLLTFLHRQLFKRMGRGKAAGSSFGYRLAELGFTIFRGIAAIAAVFFVFLFFNDWLLVTVTILIVLAILWGAKEALMKGYQKTQLLLNLGPVRQGERVLYNGLPYQVRSLSVFPLLVNPALSNSTVRITIEELGDMRMRYDGDEEPWFITEVGDYVLLSDGTYGAVSFQSPDRVKIQEAGGQSKVIPTSDFLGMSPTNLSKGYACAITFGIDYQHQGLDYGEVGRIFGEHAQRKLEEILPEGSILSTFSAFKEAGASSLDYLVVGKVTGAAQDKRPNILRALSQGCLDACNEHGWGIPFPQVTVHRAAE